MLAAPLVGCVSGPQEIVWMAGQSNSLGRTTGHVGPVREDLHYWYHWLPFPEPPITALGDIEALRPPGWDPWIGGEYELGTRLGAHVCKTARGSTALAAGVGSTGDWAPSGEEWPKAVASLRSFAALTGARVSALVWNQWETDALDVGATESYESNLRALIDRARGEVGPLRVVITAASQRATSRPAAHIDMIRAAQRAVASSVPGVAIVETSGLAMEPDAAHYTPEAQRELGRLCALEIAA